MDAAPALSRALGVENFGDAVQAVGLVEVLAQSLGLLPDLLAGAFGELFLPQPGKRIFAP
jgi:thiol:disulfide interchange protein